MSVDHAPVRLCDECDRPMWVREPQSCGPNQPPSRHYKDPLGTTFMHTSCVPEDRRPRMVPFDLWRGSGIAEKRVPWPWEVRAVYPAAGAQGK